MTENFTGGRIDGEPRLFPSITMTKNMFLEGSIGYERFPAELEQKQRPFHYVNSLLDAPLFHKVKTNTDLALQDESITTIRDVLATREDLLLDVLPKSSSQYIRQKNYLIQKSLQQLNDLLILPHMRLVRRIGEKMLFELHPISQNMEQHIIEDVEKALELLTQEEREKIYYFYGLRNWEVKSATQAAKYFNTTPVNFLRDENSIITKLKVSSEVQLEGYLPYILRK